MKKIRLFSTKAIEGIEGEEAELYVNFYLVLNRNYVFTFLIDAPDLACSNRNPIKLWKHFLLMLEEENVKYLRRYETLYCRKAERSDKEIILKYIFEDGTVLRLLDVGLSRIEVWRLEELHGKCRGVEKEEMNEKER